MKPNLNKRVKTLFLSFLLLFTYTLFPIKSQGQAYPISISPILVESIINNRPVPQLPMYKPSEVGRVLMEASNLPSPTFGKDEKIVDVTIRSYCLNKNKMANGQRPHAGSLAADQSWRLGTQVRLWYGGRDLGLYTIKDRGDRYIVGRNFDMWASRCASSFTIGKRRMIAQIVHVPKENITYWPKNRLFRKVMRNIKQK